MLSFIKNLLFLNIFHNYYKLYNYSIFKNLSYFQKFEKIFLKIFLYICIKNLNLKY